MLVEFQFTAEHQALLGWNFVVPGVHESVCIYV